MQLFTNTPIQTTFRFAKDYTVVQILGCGVIVIHSEFALNAAKQLGHRVHDLFGRKVGFSVFTYAV